MTSISELKSQRDELLVSMLTQKRQATDEELARIDALTKQISELQKTDANGRKTFLDAINRTSEPAPIRVLKSADRLADVVKGTYADEYKGLSIGRLLKGYLFGEWDGAELEQKAMASSPTSAGGMFIPSPISARVIDLARNKAAVMRAGAITVPMDTATLLMPKVLTDATAGWYSEAGAIVPSDMTLGSVTFTARKLAALVVVNSELLEDAAKVEAVIEDSIASALALELDRVALVGTGTPPQPRGVQATSNINTTTSVGTPADFDKFLTALYEVRKDNYEANAAIYHARTAETLAKLKTGLTNDKTPLRTPGDWDALAKITSNQVPINLGVGTNESLCFVGQWNQLAIGIRKQLQIEVAREGAYDISGTVYSAFQKDQVLIRAILRADVQVLQPSAFCLMSGITA